MTNHIIPKIYMIIENMEIGEPRQTQIQRLEYRDGHNGTISSMKNVST